MTYTYAKYDSDGNFVGITSSPRRITQSRWSLIQTEFSQEELERSRLVDGVVVFVEPEPEKLFEPTHEDLVHLSRAQRNALLAASDWTQVADAPVDQAAWATYRQALRDITAQAGFPTDINWPVQPV